MTSFRVAGPSERSRLDRDRPIRFRFDRRSFAGFSGDTLASALLANGVCTVGRSFKYHRPRGIYSCGVEEPNALVQLGSGGHAVPLARATVTELHDGLEAFSIPGPRALRFDPGRLLDFTPSLWAAGFYNKTFMWPAWGAYEGLVRRLAGFGRAPTGADPDRYEVRNLHCDVLVIGGGVAGLKAARSAAADGCRVLLVEQSPELGGRAAWDGSEIDGMPGPAWVDAAVRDLAPLEDLRILTRASAVGYYERDIVSVLETLAVDAVARGAPRERFWIVRAGHVVVAAGAIEQPQVFCNNDRPGIFLAGAAHKYLCRYDVAVGQRIVVATNNDSAYALARDLGRTPEVEVVAVIDTRHAVSPALEKQLMALSIPLHTRSIPVNTGGFGTLANIEVGRLSEDGRSVRAVRRYVCDALAVSGGWSPALHLYAQAGGKLCYGPSGVLEPMGAHSPLTIAGSASAPNGAELPEPLTPGVRTSPVGRTRRKWIDLKHDVTVADLELAIRENYCSIEHVKRYTTVGMSVDQGKTSNAAAIETVARLRGVQPSDIGYTTHRPPFTPVSLGAIAGRNIGERFAPVRLTPVHDWHAANGALLEDFGEWKRPAVYLRAGESRAEAVRREAVAVRTAAGLFDASSLGKIEVQGPDALEFLDRFYINNLRTLGPARVRYGIMLRESGVIFDDGTVTMLARDVFLVTTTSANAARVAAWLEEWHQCEWPRLRVAIVPVTEQWATVSIAGPRSRDILARLDGDINLDNDAFPHLGMRSGRIAGIASRIQRVSYTGERTYEISVPAGAGQDLWDGLLEAGRSHGIEPFGIDALLLLRMEKGFLHIGTDTDGTTVPDDVGWGRVAAAKKADFIGKRSLPLPENRRPDRLQLVGLASDDDLVAGSHLRLPASVEPTDGWVTSAGRAASSGAPIALALLRGGRTRAGATVAVHDAGRVRPARVVMPPFLDPAGERMRG